MEKCASSPRPRMVSVRAMRCIAAGSSPSTTTSTKTCGAPKDSGRVLRSIVPVTSAVARAVGMRPMSAPGRAASSVRARTRRCASTLTAPRGSARVVWTDYESGIVDPRPGRPSATGAARRLDVPLGGPGDREAVLVLVRVARRTVELMCRGREDEPLVRGGEPVLQVLDHRRRRGVRTIGGALVEADLADAAPE